jgi:hypothetical protein
MSRWQVELTGHRFDLEDLSKWLTDPAFEVVAEDGHFFLEANEFEALSGAAAVHDAAVRRLPLINGIGKLKSSSFQDVATGPIRERQSGAIHHHVVVKPATAVLRSRVDAVVIRGGEELPEAPAPGSQDSDAWVRIAASDPNRQRALTLWGGEHDPTTMWKVWELVRKSGVPIDPNQRRRFRPALNDRAIAGEEARHDVSVHYPVESDSMSLKEAESFLGGLLAEWFNAR